MSKRKKTTLPIPPSPMTLRTFPKVNAEGDDLDVSASGSNAVVVAARTVEGETKTTEGVDETEKKISKVPGKYLKLQ